MPLKGRDNIEEAMIKQAEFVNKSLRGIYVQGLTNIIHNTPVDTGRARNNWFITTKAPSNKTSISTHASNAQAAKVPKNVFKDKVFMTNNLPYINMLEYGGYGSGPKTTASFSDQAVGGFVRAELLKMRKKIRGVLK